MVITQENQFIKLDDKPIFNLNANSWVGIKGNRKTCPVSSSQIVRAENPTKNKIIQLMQILINKYNIQSFPQLWEQFKIIEFYQDIQLILAPNDNIQGNDIIISIVDNKLKLTKEICERPEIFKQVVKEGTTDIEFFCSATVIEKRVKAIVGNVPLKTIRQIIKMCHKYQYILSEYCSLYRDILTLRKALGITDLTPPYTPHKELNQLSQEKDRQRELHVQKRVEWLNTIQIEGYEFYANSTQQGLEQMGAHMSNCIAGYYDEQIANRKLIVVGTDLVTNTDFAFTLNTYNENARNVLLRKNCSAPAEYHSVANKINAMYREFMETLK